MISPKLLMEALARQRASSIGLKPVSYEDAKDYSDQNKKLVPDSQKPVTTSIISPPPRQMTMPQNGKIAYLDQLTNTSKVMYREKNRQDAQNYLTNLAKISALVETIQGGVSFLRGRIIVTSGYRNPELNSAVGGAKSSRHMQGLCADIQMPGTSANALFTAIRDLNLADLQMAILEGIRGKEWVHLEVKSNASSSPTVYLQTNNGSNYRKI